MGKGESRKPRRQPEEPEGDGRCGRRQGRGGRSEGGGFAGGWNQGSKWKGGASGMTRGLGPEQPDLLLNDLEYVAHQVGRRDE